MKKIAQILPYSAMALPVLALAATTDLGFFDTLITGVQGLVSTLVPLVIGLGLLFFIWGLVTYIAASGDEAAKEEGKRKMIWGIIALFVIVSVWGLVALLNQLTGVGQDDTTTPIFIPQ